MFAAGCARDPATPTSIDVVLRGETFTLDAAIDDAARARGLGGRAGISDHGGMVFIFPRPSIQNFWMYECLVPIDVAFLDARGRVTARYTMPVEPPRSAGERREIALEEAAYQNRLPRYSSRLPAQFAIELQAGTLERLGINVGDVIVLDLPRLKALAR
jgi:hypothetical protein